VQKDRIITVVLKVVESEPAAAIWDNHLHRKLLVGCQVLGIAEGDVLQERDRLLEEGFEDGD
jgi:hypothetical protein